MIKKTMIMIMLSLIPLIAQEDFLKGVRAEDLELRIIVPASHEDLVDEDLRGVKDICFWFPGEPIDYSPNKKQKAEIRTTRPFFSELWIVNLTTGKERKVCEGCLEYVQWSPNGFYLGILKEERIPNKSEPRGLPVYGNPTLHIYNLRERKLEPTVVKGYPVVHYMWSPTGNFIVGHSYDSDSSILFVVDAKTGDTKILDKTDRFIDLSFWWSPDGRMIAYAVSEKVAKGPPTWDMYSEDSEIFIINRDGSGKTQITDTPEVEEYVKWLSNGRNLLVKRSDNKYVELILKKKEKK